MKLKPGDRLTVVAQDGRVVNVTVAAPSDDLIMAGMAEGRRVSLKRTSDKALGKAGGRGCDVHPAWTRRTSVAVSPHLREVPAGRSMNAPLSTLGKARKS